MLHGSNGKKEHYNKFCKDYIVPSGRLCVAGNYRKDRRNADVYDLARWFHSQAGTWNVDKTNIVLGGYSLGGLTINNVIWDAKMAAKVLSGNSPMIKAVLLLSGTWSGHVRRAKKAKYF